ncbi:MAG TPA: hypothetical protein VHK24_00675, partial [Steroidobacter sp.]|nr:hypothetical protein [Steroidobacter sp.]
MKILRWTLLAIGVLAAVGCLLLVWLVRTESGARFTAATVSNVLGAGLEIGAVKGTIAGPLTLSDVHYLNYAAGVDVEIKRLSIDLALTELMHRLVRVRRLELVGVDVLLREPQVPRPAQEKARRLTLKPPIDVLLDSLTIVDAQVQRRDQLLLDLTRASVKAHWTSAELKLERLDLRSPQGEVEFAGRVAQKETYFGEARGRFRWRLGERTYAGSLTTVAKSGEAHLNLALRSPLRAQLQLFIRETANWPWRFTFDAPPFDPREALLPHSSLDSLAASLKGEGSLHDGAITGRVMINGEPLVLEPLRITRSPDRIRIESALRIGKSTGQVLANAALRTQEKVWSAQIASAWRDVVVPAAWAGQELHTHGRLEVHGNPKNYSATGALSLGPADRLAEVVLKLHGTPDAVELGRFEVVQPKGTLAASGKIRLKPQIAWAVGARAQRFDPGAFAAAWRGALDFDVASEGRLTEEGPAGTFSLQNLAGDLRGRKLSGRAQLTLMPKFTLAGTLALKSGAS